VKIKPLSIAIGCLCLSGLVVSGQSFAQTSDETTQQQIKVLQEQLQSLKKQVEEKDASGTKDTSKRTMERLPVPTDYKPGTVNMHTGQSIPSVADSDNFLHRTRDDSLTFGMPGEGGITLYGQFNVSGDYVSNGLAGAANNGIGTPGQTVPYGKGGYMPAISTNSTMVGLRGFQHVSDWHDTQFLWQLQTNIALTTVGGTVLTNSNQSNVASGSLTTGTSYIGFGSKSYGAVKVGKTGTPYASSTNIFNPFGGMLGSMNVIMGNSGGDNRVEFGTPVEHAIWYASPSWNNVSFAALFSPGQNRANDSSAIPSGSSNCNGGNIPGSGGSISPGTGTNGCNDGGFSNAFSTSLVYDDKALYVVAAYETHQSVNRSSDIGAGIPGYTIGVLATMDVATETAAKVGAMYHFQSTGTRIGGFFESMKRDVPAVLAFQNERQRNGTWLVIEQDLPGANQINFGWAHAATAQGDPGQHNDGAIAGAPGQQPDNSANMYTLAGIHQVDRNLSVYANYAMTVNAAAAHYDLGAGGHGVTTDCHDAGGPIPANGGITGSPNCWAGAKLQGISVGMKYRF
jgi:hypothetical protein